MSPCTAKEQSKKTGQATNSSVEGMRYHKIWLPERLAAALDIVYGAAGRVRFSLNCPFV